MQPLTVLTPKGERMTLRFDESGRQTLLYVLSPACHFCDQNERSIAHLASAVSDHVNVIGIATTATGLDEYVQKHNVSFQVFSLDVENPSYKKPSFLVGLTPDTILLDAKGVVVQHWTGAYTSPLDRTIEKYFNIDLPEFAVGGATH